MNPVKSIPLIPDKLVQIRCSHILLGEPPPEHARNDNKQTFSKKPFYSIYPRRAQLIGFSLPHVDHEKPSTLSKTPVELNTPLQPRQSRQHYSIPTVEPNVPGTSDHENYENPTSLLSTRRCTTIPLRNYSEPHNFPTFPSPTNYTAAVPPSAQPSTLCPQGGRRHFLLHIWVRGIWSSLSESSSSSSGATWLPLGTGSTIGGGCKRRVPVTR